MQVATTGGFAKAVPAGERSFIPRPREATLEAPRVAITTSLDERHRALQPCGGAEER